MEGSIVIDEELITGMIVCDPEIVSGTPVFAGTCVPIKNLFDYLRGGHNLNDFFEDFPSVRPEQVQGVLDLARDLLVVQVTGK